jgi:adenine-specific DNA-methyltransferase
MQNLLRDLIDILKNDDRLVVEGKLLKNKVIELGLQLDKSLIKSLLQNPSITKHFFEEIDDILVFDKIKFQKFVSNKAFLPDSFTSFKNKIGLTSDEEYISATREVLLAWPYKDCVLEGGQTKNEDKRGEVFWNETLAPDEIDRLFTPKVITNFKRYTHKDINPVKELRTNENFIIKGNNLLTLHTLKALYTAKIKLIYIDPPYNTGKDSFGYNDSFNHSAWLTFIKNRLEVARELLSKDGVIFISIDINEQAYLKVLCDEIFDRSNFIGEIIWETATDNNATQISVEHEYVICYAKNKENQDKWQIKSEKAQVIQNKYEELKSLHGNDIDSIEKDLRNWLNGLKKSSDIDISGVSHYSYVDEKGVFYPGNSANTKPGGYLFDIVHPRTKGVCNKPDNGYRWPETTFWDADKRGEVLWGEDENSIPKIKKRLDTATELLKGYFYEDNRKSTKALTKMMGGKVFDNPKSVNLLKKIIRFTTKDDDIILDFFAGSGSTGEAVLQVNKEDKSNRRFILCEQLDYAESITAARVQKCLSNSTFIYCELANLNQTFADSLKQVNSIKELLALWNKIKTKSFFSWRANLDEVEDLFENGLEDNLPELKMLFYEILDKNQLYIPLSEILDTDYRISKEERIICNSFFTQKIQ